jgi:hypothetical protein
MWKLIQNAEQWENHKRDISNAYQTAVPHSHDIISDYPFMVKSTYEDGSSRYRPYFSHDFLFLDDVLPLIKVEHDRLLNEKIDSTILIGE